MINIKGLIEALTHHDIDFPGDPAKRQDIFVAGFRNTEVIRRIARPENGAVGYFHLVGSSDEAIPEIKEVFFLNKVDPIMNSNSK